jgi:Protein of unknown function (DUF3684)
MESIRARERPKEVSVDQALIHNSKPSFVSYLPQLRELALEKDKLEKGTILRMTRSKILLGSRRMKRGDNASIGGDIDDWYLHDELLRPSEVVIVDDTNAYQLFGDRIFCAPQDDVIESTQSGVFGIPCITYCH